MQNSNRIRFYETMRIPKDPRVHRHVSSSEPDHFCDDNPSNNPAPTAKYRDHNALIILPLTTYRHKMKNANPKKKSTGKTTFLQKSCVQENEK